MSARERLKKALKKCIIKKWFKKLEGPVSKAGPCELCCVYLCKSCIMSKYQFYCGHRSIKTNDLWHERNISSKEVIFRVTEGLLYIWHDLGFKTNRFGKPV